MMGQNKVETIVKKEAVNYTEWYLVAVSEAARKYRNLIRLKSGENKIGRSRKNDICLNSGLCSKSQCILCVNEVDVILKDNSQHGTRINKIKFKNSRQILCSGDLIGFGCNVDNRHINDSSDKIHYVYRVSYGNPLKNAGTISIDSDDEDEGMTNNNTSSSNNRSIIGDTDGNSTDEEDPEDLIDVKPDIHSLMRSAREYRENVIEIKQEIDWMAQGYDNKDREQVKVKVEPENCVDLCDDDDTDDDIIIPPENKRKKIDPERHKNVFEQPIPECHTNSENRTLPESQKIVEIQPIPEFDPPPIYEVKSSALKQKAKFVVRSKSQQLSLDFLKPPTLLLNDMCQPSTSRKMDAKPKAPNAPKPLEIIDRLIHNDEMNQILSDITSWDVQWVLDKELSHKVEFKLKDLAPIEDHFKNLTVYQRKMQSFNLLELYSIILDEYNRDSEHRNIFTKLNNFQLKKFGNKNLPRFVYDCSAVNDTQKPVHIGDFAIVKHSQGQFLAIVTKIRRNAENIFFDLQAAEVRTNKNLSKSAKYINVKLVKNIIPQLEYLYALYSITDKHPLLMNILDPLSDIDDCDVEKENETTIDFIYRNFFMSAATNEKYIYTVNGGPGTGKSDFVVDLLWQFIDEKFKFGESILVCGISNALVDDLALRLLGKCTKNGMKSPEISKTLVRYGNEAAISKKLDSVKFDLNQKLSDEKCRIMFLTVDNVTDLLRRDVCRFDICIVDDASLIPEAYTLPLLRFEFYTLVLVGDKKLKSSFILNDCCRRNGFTRSLFGRIIDNYEKSEKKDKLYRTLPVQHRMHPDICQWTRKKFYNNEFDVNRGPRIRSSPFETYTVYKVNTIEDNEMEFLQKLMDFCVGRRSTKYLSYGIICGHTETRSKLELMIKDNSKFNGIEVSGYDCFQGFEKDVIIISALKPKDGFELLSTLDNLIVALTRSKQSLIFCGNFQQILQNYSEEMKEMRQLWEHFINDARQQKRFFDLDGEFKQNIIRKSLIPA